MIISDLRYIASATETEVQGGGKPKPPKPPKPHYLRIDPSVDFVCPSSYNAAGAEAAAQAFGSSTTTSTTTDTLVIQGQSSSSYSSSFAQAS